jgi:hypothetical protein
MIHVKLSLPIKKKNYTDIVLELSENSSWGDLEYAFANTYIFQHCGLYYHGAKLWHLVDKENYDNGIIISNCRILKNLNLGNNVTIYLDWEKEEPYDSP